MSIPAAQLFIFVVNRLACIKVVGRANFTTSIDFKALVNELTMKGYTCYVLDLSECVLMDSTFLGVLAGMGLKAARSENNGKAIELLNPNARISELLENLGVAHLFKTINNPAYLPAGATPTPAPASKPTREEVTRNCLEAHRLLMEISPANIPKFKEVTQFLAEDLKKLKPET